MSNLGKYEELVVQAKQSGGVDELLAKIRADAVAKASPGRISIGVTVGIALTLTGVAAVEKYKKVRAAGREAENLLRADAAKNDQSNGSGAETQPTASRNSPTT